MMKHLVDNVSDAKDRGLMLWAVPKIELYRMAIRMGTDRLKAGPDQFAIMLNVPGYKATFVGLLQTSHPSMDAQLRGRVAHEAVLEAVRIWSETAEANGGTVPVPPSDLPPLPPRSGPPTAANDIDR